MRSRETTLQRKVLERGCVHCGMRLEHAPPAAPGTKLRLLLFRQRREPQRARFNGCPWDEANLLEYWSEGHLGALRPLGFNG